jgi:hypothetical protein
VAEVAGDELRRVRPRGVAVGKVAGPHAVVRAPPRQDMAADRVVEECG